MDYVIIKLYADEMLGDFHDATLSDREAAVKQMQDYASQHGRKLFFAPLTNPTDGLLGGAPFAEVEYTGMMGADEKAHYIEFLKTLSMDASFDGTYLTPYQTLAMVRFKKIADEIVELT